MLHLIEITYVNEIQLLIVQPATKKERWSFRCNGS